MSSPVQVRDRLSESLSGAYRIESELGGGGMSRVFVAEELKLGRKVVVKVLSPELAEGISTERFEREIRLAASLQHAHIVPVLASGDVDGLPWFTMPFIDGESLRARVGRGPLPLGECISVLRDIVRALVYAHERGVVHRDIKPDNVMLASGTAVVTDFGIAKALSASRGNTSATTLTQIGTSIGTPAYMAPEQAAGDPNVDSRADLYAFGCTAYELLTGQSPFAGRTAQRMLAAHLSEVPRQITELRKDTPRELASLVMRCLAKEASARPGSAAEVLRTIESVTSGPLPVTPVLRGAYQPVGPMLARYAAAFVVTALLARAAIVGTGLPSWIFPGAMAVMALGLPAILFTAYVQRMTKRLAATTPTLTPGGTVQSPRPQGMMAILAIKVSPHMSWRRTTVARWMALGVFAAMAGFMGTRVQRNTTLLTSIAVLPFENVGGDTAVEYLADGISEGLRSALRANGVRVTATASSASYKGKAIDARDVTKALGVASLLVGRVQRFGSRLRVSAELVSADGFQVWDERIDWQAADVFGLQDQILARLTSALHSNLTLDSSAGSSYTPASEAYDLYLRGQHAWNSSSQVGLERAVTLLKASIARDSLYAPAHAALAVAYLSLADGYYPPSEVIPLATSAVSRALALDDRNTTARFILGAIREQNNLDWLGAEREYLRAAEAGPLSAETRLGMAGHWLVRGDNARAIEDLQTALQLDPLSPVTLHWATLLYAAAGLPDSAIALHEKAAEIGPDYVYLEAWVGFAHRMQGNTPAALAVDTVATRILGRPTLGHITDLARLGKRDEARRLVLELEQIHRRGTPYIAPELIAFAWVELGDVERAVVYFEKGVDARSGLAAFLPYLSRFYRMPVQDQRFLRYLDRINLDSSFRPIDRGAR